MSAREVCQRANAKVTVEGSIAVLGNQYVIGLNAVSCETGDTFAQEQVSANGKEKVLDALEGAASRLRSKLGESRASIQSHEAPLTRARTHSLEALQAFSRCEEAFNKFDMSAAVGFCEQAVNLDPNFAQAYALLGALQLQTGIGGEKGMGNLKKGFELRDQVSDRENYLVSIDYYRDALGDYSKTLQLVQLWNQAYPHKADSLLHLGDIYARRGQYDESVAPLMESIQLEPTFGSYGRLLISLIRLNRLNDAKRIIRDARAHKIDGPGYGWVLYTIALLQKDQGAIAENETAARNLSQSFNVQKDFYQGRFTFIRNLLRDKKLKPENVFYFSRLLCLMGYTDEAKTAMESIDLKTLNRWDILSDGAIAMALAGDLSSAQKLTADLNKKFPDATYVKYGCVPTVQAIAALRQGKPRDAIESLALVAPYELNSPISIYIRGESYLTLHQGSQAASRIQQNTQSSFQ